MKFKRLCLGGLGKINTLKRVAMKLKSDRAAVLVLLSEFTSGDHVLLTKRADHLSSHGGEIAFPGGKWEQADADLRVTALRESHEEVGLAPELVEIVGELPIAMTRYQTSVMPYVGRVANDVKLLANKAELDSYFWVPIDFFGDGSCLRVDVFDHFGKEVRVPAYLFGEHVIWGVTARILVDLLDKVYGIELNAV